MGTAHRLIKQIQYFISLIGKYFRPKGSIGIIMPLFHPVPHNLRIKRHISCILQDLVGIIQLVMQVRVHTAQHRHKKTDIGRVVRQPWLDVK